MQHEPATSLTAIKNKRNKGSSIKRILRLLEAVANAERPMTATEINEQLGWPKATIHRLCTTLESVGYVQRLPNRNRLIPGPKMHEVATAVIAGSAYRSHRHAVLEKLSKEIGETCNISMPDGNAMLYFDRVETHWPLRAQLKIGSRVPLHCTASGKLYLSSLPAAQRRRLVSQLELSRNTKNTITNKEDFIEELNRIRAKRVGIDNEEFMQGMIAVSVPIKDHRGRMYAGLALHAPVSRMSLQQAREFVPRLREASAELSRYSSD